jgi:hypothetical protein
MALSPDGNVIYLPSLEKDHWHVVNALDGKVLAKLNQVRIAQHHLWAGRQGGVSRGLRSPYLTVADATKHEAARQVGPFGSAIRPFTVNGSQTLVFVNVNGLLGFEVGDLKTGAKLHRVTVEGFKMGRVKRHGCPSHGIGLTSDERGALADGRRQRTHARLRRDGDAAETGGEHQTSRPARWITFSLDGRWAYPSSGDVIDVKTREITLD